MRTKLKGKKLILLIVLLVLIATIAIFGFSSKETSFISAITKSNQNLQYYDENTVFVLFTKYLDENQAVIAPTSVQTQTVDKLDYVVDIPQIDGYTPLVDKLEGTLDQEGIAYLESLDYVKVVVKDNIYNIYITITYEAAPSAYTVVYYEQNAALDGYTEVQRETIGGTSGNYTGEIYTGDEIILSPEEKTGFHINTEKTKLTGKVEAFGAKIFEIYYDRNPYYLYTFNTGDSYYEPKVIRYGQSLSLTEEPTYSGYVFDGWAFSTSMEGEKITKPETMPAYNLYAEAQWIKSDTHYTLSYYTQNPDDDGYTNIGTIEVAAVSGDNLKDENQTDLKTIIENGFSAVRGDTATYYYYNEEKTKTENNNFDIVVEGKGITVVPIYFDRHVYNITLDFNDDDYSTAAEVVMGGTTYTGSYTFQVRYEQNLLEYWITANDFTTFPTGTSFFGSGRTYYFRGWQADGSSTTYVSLRLNLTSTMIADADANRNIVYYAQYSTSSTSRDLEYLFESFDQESTTTSDTRVLYEGKYYEVAEEYSQKVYTSSSMSAKEIAGVTNVGQETSNSKYQFFYDRNILKITLYNMNNVYIEKELLYGQSMEEFVDTQLNPEDFSLETPGTKDWIFEGWYQDSNYMLPMVWTNEDGTYKTITDNLVLYAKWSAPTYTVTFNTNDGTWTETDSRYVKVDDNTYTLTVTEGESLTRPADPTKLGNVASAWNYEVNSESVEYLFSDSQKVYSDLTLDLQYTANTNIPYKVRYIEAQYKDGVLIEDVSQYENIVDLAPAKEVYNNAFGTTVEELPLDIYDKENEDNYFVVNARSEKLTLTSENIDDNVIYFLYAKNPIVPYTVYYVKYQEDANGNPIRYDYGDIPADDVLLGKKDTTVAAGYATEIAEDIDGWTVNGSYSQTIKLTLKASENTMYFYYNENETGEYLINFFFMDENGVYSETPDYTYTSVDSAGKVLYGIDFDKFTYENGPTAADYDGRYYDAEKCGDAYLIVTTTSETSAMDLYFANRTDLSYTVKYQDEDGNMLLADKVVENQMYSSTITETAPSIEGYKLVDTNGQKSIQIGLNTNEIIFTYAKRTDLTYTVNYYITGTTIALADPKEVTGQTYNSVITESAIDIEGCTKLTPTTQSITIGVEENVINFYYSVRTDLSYTVKYLEQGTNIELAEIKTVNNQTYKTTVTENAIEISGYDKVDPTEKSITIEVTGNEITFYYTKRTDLSYTVKYLEQGTNIELAEIKTVNNQTYKTTVTENAIEISGYDKVDPTEKSITIEVTGNEITFYYTKRTDLSYTVKYLEQGTNAELAEVKTVNGQIYKSEVTEEAIDISGYDKVDPTEKSITIEVTGNEITFYYTKRTDLSYTVKYLEQGTNAELAEVKKVNGQIYKSEVTEQAIDISGYDKTNLEETITIEVSGNEIVFYYIKRTDLSYTVKYLEEGTETVLSAEKVVDGQTYKSEVTEDAIEISGYDKVDPTEKSITIEVTGNEIVFYYTKRTDLSYTVKYLEQDTNKELSTEKVVNGQIYKSEVTEQAIDITGYTKVNTEEKITIEVSGNEIIFYYKKVEGLSYTVNYFEEGTTSSVATSKVVNGKVFEDVVTESAIDVEGYNKVNPTEKSITIGVEENIINFYYTKRTDLDYTVNYFEEGTTISVADSKKVNNRTFKENITEEAIEVEGYNKVNEEASIVIEVENNVINFYYTKRTDLSYTVKYLEQGTEAELAEVKTVNGQTYKSEVTEEAIEISGYDKTNLEETITIEVTGNEIVFYYTKRTDLSYTVKYLEEGTGTVLSAEKVVDGQTYKSEVTENAIEISGYDKVEPIEKSITIEVTGNEITFYYTKRTDLSYTVKYLEQDTNKELSTEKVVNGQIYKSEVTEQAIDITGYTKVNTEEKITIEVSGNEIIFYYKKVEGLSYTVNYFEEGTQTKVAPSKTVDGKIFEDEVTESAIDVEGYNKVDKAESSIVIGVGENVINFYYTKRTDLSYTVKYLEQDSNAELSPAKEMKDQTFKSNITENAIDIEGYDKVDPTEKSITIEVSGNEIIFYYTKRTDLSYTVKYLEKDTNTELLTEKVVDEQTYKSTATEDAIDISGYDKVDPIEKSITIEVTGNEIVFYYTKRTDLSYTVKYLEKDTNAVLSAEKVVDGQIYKSEVTEEAIDISGYDKVDPIEKSITIEVTGNEITFYYTKRTDLSYTVKYLEEGTETVLSAEKVVDGQTYKSEVTEEAIDISGYDKTNLEETITIEVTGNEIIFYYTKRVDLSYTVKYLEKDTNKELSTEKVVNGQIYKSEVTEQAIDITGYTKVNTEEKITIEVSGNEIIFYYKKVEGLSYTVNYYEEGTETKVAPSKTVDGKIFEDEVTESAIDVEGYNKVDPTEKSIVIGVGENVINFYYTKRTDLSYTVKYLEQDSNAELSPAKEMKDQTFKSNITENAINIEGYDKVDPTEKSITIEVSGNEIIFYYTKRTDLSYTVKYLEQGSNIELSLTKTVDGKTFQEQITETARDIEGYDKVGPTESTITMAVSGNEITFYYTKRTDLSYTVKYLEQDSNEVLLAEKVVNGRTFQETITEQSVDIAGYNKVNLEESIVMEVSGNEIIFYYIKKSDIEYKVEFYYEGVLDSSKTETHQATFKQVIDSYTDNNKLGYKLDEEKNFPLQISANSDENVIQIYYVIDDAQTKEIKYTVEYYKEGTLIDIDTQINTKTVQVLDPEVLTVNKDDINLVDKYFGYRLDSTEPTEIPDEVNNGDVIKIYYVIDEANTKTLNYTVEYYKEGVLVEDDTQTVSETVQILQSDTLDVRKGEINTVNKYVGYKLQETTPNEIPDKIATGETIKVFYVIDENQRKDLSYTIEYYKDGELQKDETKEVSINVQLLQPDTIPIDKAEMVLSGKYVGYKLEKTSPAEIPTIANNGDVIRIYYIKDQFNYTVEYYYDGNIDNTKTDTFTATYKDVIKEYTDKNIFGYRLEKTEGLPLEISEKPEENVIKVYYIIDDGNTKTLNYTVEYYMDGVLQEGDTQLEYKTVQVLQPDTFEVDKSKINLVDKYVGYKLDKTEPKGIPDVATTGDVYKVYYVKDTFGYTVEYYYEGQLVSEQTENLSNLYETIIDVYPDKNNGKYYLDYTENFPMKVTEVPSNNVIKVYYEKKLSTITVHYYWDGINNTNSTVANDKKRTLGEEVDNGETQENKRVSVSQDVIIEDKVDTVHTIAAASDVAEKYELVSKPESEEITMTVEPQEFEYIYRLKDAKVIVNFINQLTGEILATQEIKGQVDDMYHAVPKDMPGFGFKHDEIPENEVGKMTIEPITVNYYYQPSPQSEAPATVTTPGEKTDFKGKGPATGDTEIIVCMAIVVAILAINISQGKILKVNTKEKVNGGKKEKLVRKRHSSKEPSKVARVSRLERNCKKGATRRQRKH